MLTKNNMVSKRNKLINKDGSLRKVTFRFSKPKAGKDGKIAVDTLLDNFADNHDKLEEIKEMTGREELSKVAYKDSTIFANFSSREFNSAKKELTKGLENIYTQTNILPMAGTLVSLTGQTNPNGLENMLLTPISRNGDNLAFMKGVKKGASNEEKEAAKKHNGLVKTAMETQAIVTKIKDSKDIYETLELTELAKDPYRLLTINMLTSGNPKDESRVKRAFENHYKGIAMEEIREHGIADYVTTNLEIGFELKAYQKIETENLKKKIETEEGKIQAGISKMTLTELYEVEEAGMEKISKDYQNAETGAAMLARNISRSGREAIEAYREAA